MPDPASRIVNVPDVSGYEVNVKMVYTSPSRATFVDPNRVSGRLVARREFIPGSSHETVRLNDLVLGEIEKRHDMPPRNDLDMPLRSRVVIQPNIEILAGE